MKQEQKSNNTNSQSKYAQKKQQQAKGNYSPNSPFVDGSFNLPESVREMWDRNLVTGRKVL